MLLRVLLTVSLLFFFLILDVHRFQILLNFTDPHVITNYVTRYNLCVYCGLSLDVQQFAVSVIVVGL